MRRAGPLCLGMWGAVEAERGACEPYPVPWQASKQGEGQGSALSPGTAPRTAPESSQVSWNQLVLGHCLLRAELGASKIPMVSLNFLHRPEGRGTSKRAQLDPGAPHRPPAPHWLWASGGFSGLPALDVHHTGP